MTEEAAATPTSGPSKCSTAERRAARNIWLWEVTSDFTSSPTGYSSRARAGAVKHTAKAEERLRDKCDGRVSPAFARFRNEIRAATEAPRFGNRQLDRVLAAWLRWGSAVGEPDAARGQIRELERCRQEFFPRFDASYRIWWKWTDTGKAWWIDLYFDNRTGKVLDGGMSGVAKATHHLDDPFGWEQGPKTGPGKDATLWWGGSSADFLELRPGMSTEHIAPDADLDVHTTSDGTFRVVEMSVGLDIRGERYGCSPPVPQSG
jgi:hypothetical protein